MKPLSGFPRSLAWAAVAALAMLSGCALTATYDAAYITAPATPQIDKLAGKALVYTVQTDDDLVWSGKPTSFTGGGTTLSIPLGVIAREIAAVVFGDAFREGAAKSNALTGSASYRVIVQPKVVAFSYEYNALKNAGFAITPTAVLTLEVSLLDPAGKLVNQRHYDSGTVETPAYFFSGAPGKEIGKAAHKALFELMTRAAQDVRASLRQEGGGPPSS